VHAASDSDYFACVLFTQIFNGDVFFRETIIGVALRLYHDGVTKLVSAGVVRVFDELPGFCGLGDLTSCKSFVLLSLASGFLVFGLFGFSFFLSFLGSISCVSLSIDLWFRHFRVEVELGCF